MSADVKRALRLSFSPPKCTTKLCMAGQTAVETATHCCPHGPGDRYGKLVCSHAFCDPALPTFISWCRRQTTSECESSSVDPLTLSQFALNNGRYDE